LTGHGVATDTAYPMQKGAEYKVQCLGQFLHGTRWRLTWIEHGEKKFMECSSPLTQKEVTECLSQHLYDEDKNKKRQRDDSDSDDSDSDYKSHESKQHKSGGNPWIRHVREKHEREKRQSNAV